MRQRTEDNEAPLWRSHYRVLQLVDQDEMPQVVDGELPLNAVDQLQVWQGHHSSIGDQSVQGNLQGAYIVGAINY